MTPLVKIISVGLLWLFILPETYSQISSPDADAEKDIAYKSYTGSDKVFIYHSPQGENPAGTLRADPPRSGSFTFDWSKYDSDQNTWGPSFNTEPAVAFSEVAGLSEGGYRIHVTNGIDVDTFYYGWIFMDELVVELNEPNPSCEVLTLSASVTTDSFSIYDPISHERIMLINDFSVLWTSDNPNLLIPSASSKNTDLKNLYNPPAEDTWFILTAVDSFGMIDMDSVFYESIHVRAEFSFEFFDKAESETYVDPPAPPQDDAPLEVRFTNESVNGNTFEWTFISDSNSESVLNTEDLNYQPVYTYEIPDIYFPKLVAISQEGCIDSFGIERGITVLPSELEAPNVFSPEGLEQNRYFKVRFKSIKSFSIRIYSRTGNLVYKADVKDMYSWDGWDGNIMNSNRPATPGAYFYVIEATGYDEVRYNKGPYKGVVYLFR